MSMYQTRKCRVCEKEIKIISDKPTGSHNYQTYSDEGVLFTKNQQNTGGVWFCNSCWDKIIKYYKKWHKSKLLAMH